MKQQFYNYKLWEDQKAGMYKKLQKDKEEFYVVMAINLMNSTEEWGKYMLDVIEEWEFSCKQNLTNNSQNKIAWIGQAACCLACGIPDYITKKVWWSLSDETQEKANKKAQEALNYFYKKYE